MTMTDALIKHDVDVYKQVKVLDTDPDKACDLFAI
jgi:hypothetical protein